MPTPTIYKADNGYFYAKWTDNRRSRRKSMGTQDRSIAEARFAQWLLIRNNAPNDPTPSYTVADVWDIYLQRNRETPTTGYSWKNLEPHFGHLPVEAVDQGQVDAYVAARASGRIGRPSKPATCRRELAMLVAAMNFGAKPPFSLYDTAILQPLVLPADSEPRDRWLSMAEMQRLLRAAAEMRRGDRLSRGERFLWLALETAARKTAILELTWDRVDFETGKIHYDVPGRAKTKKRRASVPMSSTLRTVLQRAYDEREGDLVLDNSAEVWAAIQSIAITAGFKGVRGRNGKKPTATGISPHVLRHTAATHMARNGVPLWTVANILGNTMAVVEKTYAKWVPSEPERNVDLISGGKLEILK
ncbi:Integrase [Phaeobacter inhibens]|uniref:Integrase n=1 Tax=Phaeobacter inhibens TaxID=221822 RepID=A0ABN5GRB3_9RHOB|nr:site-specific integrase [Phaeobacter inhibens]AUQ95999.1 Integrase [Phaeobacter inhibens]